jgi:hypothetical protein
MLLNVTGGLQKYMTLKCMNNEFLAAHDAQCIFVAQNKEVNHEIRSKTNCQPSQSLRD